MTSSTQSDPHGLHDWHSHEYVDAWIASDILRDEERRPLLRRMVGGLPLDRDRPSLVMDVGAGYGVLSREVLEEWPKAHVVLHDLSEAMLDQSRQRLAAFSDRTTFVQADLRDPEWTTAVGGPFDSVVSSAAIHNVRDPARIQRIYAEIAGLLVSGGCFLNIELIAPAGPRSVAALGLRGYESRNGQWPPNMVDHVEWLRAAGYLEADCLYRDGVQAVLAGFR